MTEEEAKQRWCPFAKVAFAPEAVNGCNRPFESSLQCCIGSACMAWRNITKDRVVDGRGVIVPNQEAWGPGYEMVPVVVGGFCGLAGQP